MQGQTSDDHTTSPAKQSADSHQFADKKLLYNTDGSIAAFDGITVPPAKLIKLQGRQRWTQDEQDTTLKETKGASTLSLLAKGLLLAVGNP